MIDDPSRESTTEHSESSGFLTIRDSMDWWPDLSDLDRLNVLNNPAEDRARILSSKVSLSVEETVKAMSKYSGVPLIESFDLAESPTKLLPLRLIHSFCCLPINYSGADAESFNKLKVLWVESEELKFSDISAAIVDQFDVTCVSSAEEAIKSFQQSPDFVIVVSHMKIEGVNGFDLLNKLKQKRPDILTVLLASNADLISKKHWETQGSVYKIMYARKGAGRDEFNNSDIYNVLADCEAEFRNRKTGSSSIDPSTEEQLNLLTAWPPSARMSRWVYAVSGRKPVWFLGMPEKIVGAITENFGIGADSLDESEFDLDDEDEQQDDIEDQNAAIIRFVNEVIQKAIVDRATDIHFEPHKETLQIRYRIDGQLVPVRVPDNLRSFQDAIISRIKIMSAINISEKRRPQGGRITFTMGQSDLDIRVSTLPTLYGESISLRLLNEKSQPLSMRELGLQTQDENKIVSVLEKPHGIVLVTGPTGSGKSTSLTAFIRKIHKPERRIMTVEDPVEYEVSGVNQTQVNSEIGFSFASALREILRQDPDVIMVGEIRDRETADIAIRASLTGHLVLSTLHTNDAPGAITRLIDMEIEPFLIASSVEMVIAQRLVRRLCTACASAQNISEAELKTSLSLLEIDPTEVIHLDKVLQAVGCNKCQNLGFHGRVGIFELMRMSDDIHGLIIKSASAPEIRDVALRQGMTTLQQSGWSQIKRGLTSLSEVVRYADIFAEETAGDSNP